MPPEGVKSVPHNEILTFDEIERIAGIGAGLGITRIRLTGGEPLVRRGLPVLLGRLKRIEGMEQVTLTTNGTLLKHQISELVSSGMDGVNISIDTLNEEKYRKITRTGRLGDALEGVEAALGFPGLHVKVNCVPLGEDEGEDWVRMAALAKERHLEVRFIEIMPVGTGRQYSGPGREKIYETLRAAFGEAEMYTERLGNGPADYVRFPGFAGRIGFISAISHPFCDTCNRVRLTPEGYLKTCLQYGTGTDLRKLIRAGADDREIEDAFRDAVYNKPACHCFPDKDTEQERPTGYLETRNMSGIGG